jgi:MFS family permease
MTALTPATTRSSVRRARTAITAAFITHAMLFASWTAHIPMVKAQLGLSNSGLGTALLGAPIGSVCAMLVSRWLLPRWGSHRLVRLTVAGYALSGIAVGCAPSALALFASLALWGLFQGGLDVAMNTQGVTVEQAGDKPIMSRLHGLWSIGGFTGALLGAGAVSVGTGLTAQLSVLAALTVIPVEILCRYLIPDQHRRVAAAPVGAPVRHRRRGINRTVAVLGAVCFASMLCEGAAADWSANYLTAHLGAPAGLAGLGYAGYTLTMVAMRLSGPVLQARIPNRTLLPLLALVPVMGMTIALLTGNLAVGLLGFASLGVGLTLVVPTAFSAAGAATSADSNAGQAISTVAAVGWIGYVTGPPLIGHLADALGLRTALGLLPVLLLLIAITIRTARAWRPVDD